MQEQKVSILPFNPQQYVDKIYVACRTCYMQGTPQEQYAKVHEVDDEKKWKLIHHVIGSGHHSTLEHITFTFLISGVSRALSHQFVRHRAGISFSQQSQRYCVFNKGFEFVTPPSIEQLSEALEEYNEAMRYLDNTYKKFVGMGIPAEDARMLLPNACCTNLTVTVNLRELIHFCGERCCNCAQWEIRRMARSMAKLVYSEIPELKPYLGPKCQLLGYCNESAERSCGRRPLKENAFKETSYQLS